MSEQGSGSPDRLCVVDFLPAQNCGKAFSLAPKSDTRGDNSGIFGITWGTVLPMKRRFRWGPDLFPNHALYQAKLRPEMPRGSLPRVTPSRIGKFGYI
jgi:hypothetical protein